MLHKSLKCLRWLDLCYKVGSDGMPKIAPHRKDATRASGPAERGFRLIGRAIRNMRLERQWTQVELAKRILRAEGYDEDYVKDFADNMRVSRCEQGHPTTLRNLTGFALAFGYRTVWDWLEDVFGGSDLTEREKELLTSYRATDPAGHPAVMALLEALQHTALARKAEARKGPKLPRRPQ